MSALSNSNSIESIRVENETEMVWEGEKGTDVREIARGLTFPDCFLAIQLQSAESRW